MKKITMTLAIVSLLTLAACAGKTPNPVPQQQPGDSSLSCDDLKLQIADNEAAIMKLIPEQNKTGKNVALGAAGAFFIVPLFFMDFSDAERIEVEAYRRRDNYLRILAKRKNCGKIGYRVQFQAKPAHS